MARINWDNKNTDDLAEALSLLENPSHVKTFLRDLLTESELVEFGNRLKAARMLMKGVHYNAIVERTGLSSRTVARVKKWLKGKAGGYRLVIRKLDGS